MSTEPKGKHLEKAAYIVTIVSLPILVVSLLLGYFQLKDLKQAVSSQNNISLNTMFFNDTNTGIIDAIENAKPILVEHNGKYTDAQLDNYLGDFESVDQAYDEKLLTEDELCVSFSYYIASTTQNTEIKNYIASNRSFFSGLAALAGIVSESKDTNCH